LPGKKTAGARCLRALVLVLAATLLFALLVVVAGCKPQGGEAGEQTVWSAYSAEKVALYPVTVNRAMGYIDSSGSMVIPAQFAEAGRFSEGLAAVRPEANGPWGYIDKTGSLIIEAQFAGASPFSQGRAAVQPEFEGPWGLIDTSGTLVIPAKFVAAWPFSEDLARVRTEKEAGYIDSVGKWVIRMKADLPVDEFSQGLAPVYEYETNKYGFIDKGGSIVIAPAYEEAWGFSEDLAAVKLPAGQSGPGLWGYIDKHGDWFIDAQFAKARSFSEGLAAAQKDAGGKWGFIDSTGTQVIQPEWEEAYEFHEGRAMVAREIGYDEASGPVYAYAYVDTEGNVIWRDATLTAFLNGTLTTTTTTAPPTESTVAP
jgi:hypothetical protein